MRRIIRRTEQGQGLIWFLVVIILVAVALRVTGIWK